MPPKRGARTATEKVEDVPSTSTADDVPKTKSTAKAAPAKKAPAKKAKVDKTGASAGNFESFSGDWERSGDDPAVVRNTKWPGVVMRFAMSRSKTSFGAKHHVYVDYIITNVTDEEVAAPMYLIKEQPEKGRICFLVRDAAGKPLSFRHELAGKEKNADEEDESWKLDARESATLLTFVAGPNHSQHRNVYDYLPKGKFTVSAVYDGIVLWSEEITGTG